MEGWREVTSTDFHVRYDRASDVLYISVAKGIKALSKEGDPGLLWRYAVSDGHLVGLTVVDFDTYWRKRLESLTEQLADRFHVAREEAARKLSNVH